jgi:hypothetical protein
MEEKNEGKDLDLDAEYLLERYLKRNRYSRYKRKIEHTLQKIRRKKLRKKLRVHRFLTEEDKPKRGVVVIEDGRKKPFKEDIEEHRRAFEDFYK